MKTLNSYDLHRVVGSLPKDIRELIVENRGLIIGGGYIRSRIEGAEPSDIDIFGPEHCNLLVIAEALVARRNRLHSGSCRLHRTPNAITVLSLGRLPVQFITRWRFDSPVGLMDSFDFTVCQAAIFLDDAMNFCSIIGERFYEDLAARRLVYLEPVRDEEAGGSIMRVRKFLARGYTILAPDLAAVIAQMIKKVDLSRIYDGLELKTVIESMLREVDPLHIIDGLDLQSQESAEGQPKEEVNDEQP